jgi:hypothetical protein
MFGFVNHKTQRPSVTPEEMGALLLGEQPGYEDEAPGLDESPDLMLDDAISRAAKRAAPQQTAAGERRLYGV